MSASPQETADILRHAGLDKLFNFAQALEKDYLKQAAKIPDIILVPGAHVDTQALRAAHALGEVSSAVLLVKAEIAHRESFPMSPAERLRELRKELPEHMRFFPGFTSGYEPSYD